MTPGAVHGWGNYSTTGRPVGLADAIAVKAAYNYTFALRSDHTIALWGVDSSGQLDAPAGLSNVVAIAAGYYMGMALKDDGTVQVWGAWGHVFQGAIVNPPASATNVIAIAGGMDHCLALRDNGTVVAWGDNIFGQCNVPPDLTNVVQIAAGQAYSLAVNSAGQIVTWGDIAYYGSIPSNATNVVAAALSSFGHGLALRQDGTVVAWGNNSAGQATVPAGLSNVVAIAAGDQHSVALRSDGSLVAWGANDSGQGVVPANLVVAKAIAAGTAHDVIISDAPLVESASDDQALAAGSNLDLQAVVTGSAPWQCVWLKDGVSLGQTSTTLSLHDLQATNAGVYTCIASNAFGATSSRGISVWVNAAAPHWIQQPQNQAVLPGETATFFADVAGSEPLWFQWAHDGVTMAGATSATLQISPVTAADEGSYVVLVTNAYGYITSAPCLLGATVPRILSEPCDLRVRTNWVISLDVSSLSSLPVGYRWFKDGVEVSGAAGASLLLASVQGSDAGMYQVEVTNQFGAAWSDPARITVLPSQVTPLEPSVVVEWGSAPFSTLSILGQETNAVALAVGTWHTVIARQDGSVRVWGDPNALSLLTIPAEATNVVDVSAGPSDCLALRSDGTVVGWGDGSPGQAFLPGVSNVIAVAGGPNSYLLLKTDGTVARPEGYEVPVNVTNIVGVSLTSLYSIAVEANGRVLTWWGPSQTLATEVPGLTNVIAVAGGESYASAALRADGTMVEWDSYPITSWNVVAGISNAVAVAGGRGFMALLPNGQVQSWGTEIPSIPAPAVLHANQLAFSLKHQAALTPAPFFDTHPQSQTNYAGATATLAAAVRSATPVSLQWYYEDAAIPGATNTTLQLSSARPSQSGHYKLIARNAAYVAESLTALLSVQGPADILELSTNQNISAGQALQLQVQYVANPPASVQWRFNGLPIPGATNGTLFLPDAAEWMSGSYTLSLSNAYGVVVTASIQVLVSPAAPTIVTQPSAPSQVPDGASLTLQVAAIGSEPLAYQWFFNGTALTGQVQPALQLPSVSSADNGPYQVIVTNAVGSATSVVVSVTSVRAAPSPEVTPRFQVVREGKTFQLQARPGGTVGARYQWRLNGAELDGETNGMLVISTATLPDSGTYSVLAVNDIGQGESAGVRVQVLRNPGTGLIRAWGLVTGAPGSVPAEAVACGGSHALALLPDGTVKAWGNNGYLQATPPAGLSNAVAIAAGQDFSLALRTDGTVLAWGRNDSNQASPPTDLTDTIAIAAGPTHALALRADGSVVAWGNASYTRVPTNLPALVSIVAGPTYSLALAGDGKVWAWGAPTTQGLTNVPASVTNAMALAAGATSAYALDRLGSITAWPSAPTWPADATNLTMIAAGSSFGVALRADAQVFAWGNDFYGQISGPRGSSNMLAVAAGSATTLALTADPRIVSSAMSQTVRAGSDVVLSVSAAGAAPLSFQWSFNGQPLTGSTNTSLAIGSFAATNGGTYSIRVTNAYGSAQATLATLTLALPPTITSQPADQAVTVGSNATFVVQCAGTAPFSYQWAFKGTHLAGATATTLTLTNLQFQDQGSVSVQVANAFGAAVSRQAALVVLPRPSRMSVTRVGSALGLRLTLQPSRSYSLLTSTNLVDWVALQNLGSPGTNVEITLPLASDRVRFYRLLDVTP